MGTNTANKDLSCVFLDWPHIVSSLCLRSPMIHYGGQGAVLGLRAYKLMETEWEI